MHESLHPSSASLLLRQCSVSAHTSFPKQTDANRHARLKLLEQTAAAQGGSKFPFAKASGKRRDHLMLRPLAQRSSVALRELELEERFSGGAQDLR